MLPNGSATPHLRAHVQDRRAAMRRDTPTPPRNWFRRLLP